MINSFNGKYEFLSNFFLSPIEYEGIVYPTVEHAFQAAKTFDLDLRKEIAMSNTPGKAKRAGRRLQLRSDWEEEKDKIMYECVKKKFQAPHLKEKLLNTKNEELIEGTTWHDNYWGNCSCHKCENIEGQNHLGKILMKIRKEFLNE